MARALSQSATLSLSPRDPHSDTDTSAASSLPISQSSAPVRPSLVTSKEPVMAPAVQDPAKERVVVRDAR